ncbi:MAG: CRISPR-associated protein Csx16 [Rhodocyclaceae bacterium]
MHLAAEFCASGGRYLNLSLDMPPELQGKALDAGTLERLGTRLEEYIVRKAP